MKEREEEKLRLRQKQLEERKKNEEEEIRKSNMSESEKERLLKQHEENMEKLKENFIEEQNRYAAGIYLCKIPYFGKVFILTLTPKIASSRIQSLPKLYLLTGISEWI